MPSLPPCETFIDFSVQRGLSFLQTPKPFLCLAATFYGLRLRGQAQPPVFQMLSPCFADLCGMADWGRRGGVSPPSLVEEGDLRPGVVGIAEGLIPSGSP